MSLSHSHILSEHGIMSSFSIAKKINPDDIVKLSKQLNMKENSKEFQEELKKQILRDTQIALYNGKIPGVILNQNSKNKETEKTTIPNKKRSLDDDKKSKFALFASLLVKKILEQKSTTEEKCFLIVQIVNGLGLKDSDFKKFHSKQDDDDDDNDEDLDDDFQ